MVDTQKLQEAVNHFKSVSRPSSSNKSDLATVGDIHNLIEKTAKMMDTFIKELENN